MNGEADDLIRQCYSTWGTRYYDDFYRGEVAYPPVHTKIVRELLTKHGAMSVLDAGCGPASMLRDLDLAGLDRFGFDLTPEMLAEGRRILAAQQVPEDHLWLGSVLEASSFQSGPASAPDRYDAAICFGVMPHVPVDAGVSVLRNLASAVRPGGLVACEARNELFALFTLNRYTQTLFRSRLINLPALQAHAKQIGEDVNLDAMLACFDTRFRLDLPALRKGYQGEPGYDEVLSLTHNPFEMVASAREAGLRDVEVLFYHYHALPPMVEELAPKFFRAASLAMENPRDWRGYFMASAFIVVGIRE